MYPPKNDESALDSLEHELNSPKKKITEIEPHHVENRRSLDLPTSWGEQSPILTEVKVDHGSSFGIKMLIFSLLLLLAAGGFTAWRVFSLRNVVSSANIEMTADISPYVEGGEVTDLTFTLGNKNTSQLDSATLTLSYKKGVGSQDEQEKVFEKRDIGTIKAGEYKRQAFNVTLFGEEAEQRDISLKLEYKVAGSNGAFSKTITQTVTLKTPPVSVHIAGPEVLSSSQAGAFTITVKNNSASSSLPSVLQVVLPNTFTTTTLEPKPITRGTVWNIPQLRAGESKIITINGSLTGKQGESTTMRAIIGSAGDSPTTVGVVYASETKDVKIRTSPLVFSVSLDTDSGTSNSLRYGDKATLVVTYINAGTISLHNVGLKLSLEGDAALYKQIDPGVGYFDSLNQTITWDKSIINDLELIPPGGQGTLRIVIPIVTRGENSPVLKMSLMGSGSSQAENDVVAAISNTWVVQGSARIHADTLYRSSPFENSGPVPPVPNVATTYTAHVSVSAQNSLINTKVSFTLPIYVSWRGFTSDNALITYDQRTRAVTWAVGKIDAGKTVVADIGLSVKPSQSHVGQSPAITSGIVLDADEELSRAHLRTTISALTTALTQEAWEVNPSKVVDR